VTIRGIAKAVPTKVGSVLLIGVVLSLAACTAPATVHGRTPPVTQSPTLDGSTTIAVNSPEFQVVITASGPVWIQVTSGLWHFVGLLQTGESHVAESADGKVSVVLGSLQVKVAVQIESRAVPIWTYSPPRAPITLNFASTDRPPGVLIGLGVIPK
jgi:hypothetical protein